MPNWCSNSINVENATPEQIKRILDACKQDRFLDEFFPQPDWRMTPNEDGVLPGPEYSDRFYNRRWRGISRYELVSRQSCFPDGSTDGRWYHWRVQNWGTKWEVEAEASADSLGRVSITFLSAWAPPSDLWFEHFSSAMPGAFIVATFTEPGMDFCGCTVAKAGSAQTKTTDISTLKQEFVKEEFPDLLDVYNDDEHDDHYDVQDEVDNAWYDVEPDVIDKHFTDYIRTMREELPDTTGWLKGDKLLALAKLMIKEGKSMTDVFDAYAAFGYPDKETFISNAAGDLLLGTLHMS